MVRMNPIRLADRTLDQATLLRMHFRTALAASYESGFDWPGDLKDNPFRFRNRDLRHLSADQIEMLASSWDDGWRNAL